MKTPGFATCPERLHQRCSVFYRAGWWRTPLNSRHPGSGMDDVTLFVTFLALAAGAIVACLVILGLTNKHVQGGHSAARRVRRLNRVRVCLFALCWLLWASVGAALAHGVISIHWRWFTVVCALLALIFEGAINYFATRKSILRTLVGNRENRGTSSARLVGALSLPFSAALTRTTGDMIVFAWHGFFVGITYSMCLFWPKFPDGSPVWRQMASSSSRPSTNARTSANISRVSPDDPAAVTSGQTSVSYRSESAAESVVSELRDDLTETRDALLELREKNRDLRAELAQMAARVAASASEKPET